MCKRNSSGESLYRAYTFCITGKRDILLSSEIAGIGFIKKGEIYLSAGEIKEKKVVEGNLIFFPPGMLCTVFTPFKSSLFILEIPEITPLCYRFLPITTFQKTEQKEEFLFTLPIHPYIENVIHITEDYLQNGMTDSFLIEIKVNELFHFLNTCYKANLLYQFFSPVFSEKYRFTHFVLSYYMSVKTVEELARLSSYSLSGFDKEFRKVFGMAPYKWIIKMKTKSICRDIKETSKPFKQIAKEHNFETPSGLTDFCRRHIGLAPSLIRKKREKIGE